MTREEARKAAEVMMAYAEGKDIEYKLKGNMDWMTFRGDDNERQFCFDFTTSEYCIKKKPKYRPFEDKEECWNEMQKHQPFGWIKDCGKYINIIGLCDEEAELVPYEVDMDYDLIKNYTPFNYMFQIFTFADGTPFGIKEE